jgi:hypothetical protein
VRQSGQQGERVHRRFSCSRSPVRSHRCRRRVAAGGARAEYRNFGRVPLDPSAIAEGSAVSTDRSGDDGASPAAVHILRIDDWMRIIRCTHEGWRDARRTGRARFPPDDGVDEAFRRRRRGDRRRRVCCKKFRYSAHSEPAATRRRAPGGQVATKSTKNRKRLPHPGQRRGDTERTARSLRDSASLRETLRCDQSKRVQATRQAPLS